MFGRPWRRDASPAPDRAIRCIVLVGLLTAATIGATGASAAQADSGNGGCAIGAQATQPDFNFDGYADLAAGVPAEDIGVSRGVKDSGAVHVIYGSGAGLQATGVGAPDDQLWYQDAPDVLDLSESNDRLGDALAWGDFNGDAYTDLAIGVPRESVLGPEGGVVKDAGAVNVLYGSSLGLQATGLGGPDDQLFTEAALIGGGTPEVGDLFGSSLTSGDFNNDDYCDLAVGIPYQDYVDGNGTTHADIGTFTIIYGSGAGLDDTFVPRQRYEPFGIIDPPNSFGATWASLCRPDDVDRFGFSFEIAAGDFNADGFDDLAASCPFPVTVPVAGDVFWFLGGPTGLVFPPFDPGQPFHEFQVPGMALPGLAPSSGFSEDTFGFAMAVGDFDADGHADLAIGAPTYDPSFLGDHPAQGAVAVVFGNDGGLTDFDPVTATVQFFTQDSDGIPGDSADGDNFGDSLAAGDFNGNGVDDLAIGVPYDVINDVTGAGSVNLLYGIAGVGLTPFSDAGSPLTTQGTLGIQEIPEKNDVFGWDVSSADYNGDGSDDLAVGAEGEDLTVGRAKNVTDAGIVHAIYGTSVIGLQGVNPDDQVWSQARADVLDEAESNDLFGQVLSSH
jgi:hypothetical protein